jgi:dCMP deaminase
MERPDWDTTWQSVAYRIGRRSRCDGRQIGAAIVSADNAYIVVGYNGPPASLPIPDGSTCQDWCPRMLTGDRSTSYGNCVSVHAETNAIAKADRTRIEGGTLYVTSAICWDCGKVVANSGVARIVCRVDMAADAHREPMKTINFLRDCGIDVEVWE